jgi:ribonuclease G
MAAVIVATACYARDLDLLREGQEILVQIAKEPIARKELALHRTSLCRAGFWFYMPTIEHLGVSRKIESSNERGRLRHVDPAHSAG